MLFTINVNGSPRQVDVDPDMPLLWVLRDVLRLTGTKYGCGIAECGACTVHLDGTAVRACATPIEAVGAMEVTTIEGLAAQPDHPVVRAWREADVPQCGYCQPGMIMAASALIAEVGKPTDRQIDDAVTNICRCGTYDRVRAAIHRAAEG